MLKILIFKSLAHLLNLSHESSLHLTQLFYFSFQLTYSSSLHLIKVTKNPHLRPALKISLFRISQQLKTSGGRAFFFLPDFENKIVSDFAVGKKVMRERVFRSPVGQNFSLSRSHS